MNLKVLLFLMVFPLAVFSQNKDVNPELLKKANSVILDEYVNVKISTVRNMLITQKKSIMIMNKKGVEDINAYVYFSKSTKVKDVQAELLDISGKSIKKYKKKDFKEQSTSQGFEVSDDRILFLDINYSNFPFIVNFESVVETTNTAFVPNYFPLKNYNQSIVHSTYQLDYPESIDLKVKNTKSNVFSINDKSSNGSKVYEVSNIEAIESEYLSPSLYQVLPNVRFSLPVFHLEGYDGKANSWQEFSAWMYNDLLKGTESLSAETVSKIESLTKGSSNDLDKIKIVYKFVQNKTRYISVQLGIGGWKPMLAKDVDRLGYGDCKALTNYTRALLKAINIESYYTVIYGGSAQRDIDPDFTALEGNHAILAVPYKDDYIWLECTSQTNPFGYIANFTDNRYALIIDEKKGQIIKTKKYQDKDNRYLNSVVASIDNKGNLKAKINRAYSGSKLDDILLVSKLDDTDKQKYYREEFSQLIDLSFSEQFLQLQDDENTMDEKLTFSSSGFAKKADTYLMISLNPLIKTYSTLGDSNRKTDIVIQRGFVDVNEVVLNIPEGYTVESMPRKLLIDNKFGKITADFFMEANQIKANYTFELKSGQYSKEEQTDLRSFFNQYFSVINQKILLTSNL